VYSVISLLQIIWPRAIARLLRMANFCGSGKPQLRVDSLRDFEDSLPVKFVTRVDCDEIPLVFASSITFGNVGLVVLASNFPVSFPVNDCSARPVEADQRIAISSPIRRRKMRPVDCKEWPGSTRFPV
jgi:hypothetical protein